MKQFVLIFFWIAAINCDARDDSFSKFRTYSCNYFSIVNMMTIEDVPDATKSETIKLDLYCLNTTHRYRRWHVLRLAEKLIDIKYNIDPALSHVLNKTVELVLNEQADCVKKMDPQNDVKNFYSTYAQELINPLNQLIKLSYNRILDNLDSLLHFLKYGLYGYTWENFVGFYSILIDEMVAANQGNDPKMIKVAGIVRPMLKDKSQFVLNAKNKLPKYLQELFWEAVTISTERTTNDQRGTFPSYLAYTTKLESPNQRILNITQEIIEHMSISNNITKWYIVPVFPRKMQFGIQNSLGEYLCSSTIKEDPLAVNSNFKVFTWVIRDVYEPFLLWTLIPVKTKKLRDTPQFVIQNVVNNGYLYASRDIMVKPYVFTNINRYDDEMATWIVTTVDKKYMEQEIY